MADVVQVTRDAFNSKVGTRVGEIDPTKKPPVDKKIAYSRDRGYHYVPAGNKSTTVNNLIKLINTKETTIEDKTER